MLHWAVGISGDLVQLGDPDCTIAGKEQLFCYNTRLGCLPLSVSVGGAMWHNSGLMERSVQYIQQ